VAELCAPLVVVCAACVVWRLHAAHRRPIKEADNTVDTRLLRLTVLEHLLDLAQRKHRRTAADGIARRPAADGRAAADSSTRICRPSTVVPAAVVDGMGMARTKLLCVACGGGGLREGGRVLGGELAGFALEASSVERDGLRELV
jgi:hypothetical protein